MTKRKKRTREETVRSLRRAEELLVQGNDLAETYRKLNATQATWSVPG